jgi:putative transcriptional regulator
MNPSGFLAHQLLIAMPSMLDPNFARSVALVCQHDAHGALGIVVNRLAPLAVGDVLSQLGFEAGNPAVTAAPVYLGGPVQPERGFVIHDGDAAYDSTLSIAPGLKLTTSRDVLGALAAGRGPRRALLALGYAGWGAGQLESELRDNAWLTVDADHDLIFDLPIDARWEAAARLVGVDVARLSGEAGRA